MIAGVCGRCGGRHLGDGSCGKTVERSLTPTLVTGAVPSMTEDAFLRTPLDQRTAFLRSVQGERDELRVRLADVTAAYESAQKDLTHASDRRQREQTQRLAADKRAADAEARAEAAERELSQMALKTARELLAEVRALLDALRGGQTPVKPWCLACDAERLGVVLDEADRVHRCGPGDVL